MSDEIGSEISAELAIGMIERLRKRGGFGRAFGTVFAALGAALFASVALGPLALTTALLYGAVSIGCGWIVVRNLRQNSFIDRTEADRLRKLPEPRCALLIGNRLLVGTRTASRADWAKVELSDRELRELRTLALPGARVVAE